MAFTAVGHRFEYTTEYLSIRILGKHGSVTLRTLGSFLLELVTATLSSTRRLAASHAGNRKPRADTTGRPTSVGHPAHLSLAFSNRQTRKGSTPVALLTRITSYRAPATRRVSLKPCPQLHLPFEPVTSVLFMYRMRGCGGLSEMWPPFRVDPVWAC